MAITITGLGGSAPVRPVVSAVVEFGSALHVLRDPGHHGAERWAADTWAKMSPRLAGRTELWWWTTQAIRATPFVTAAPADDFDEWLARLRAMPVRELAGQLLRPIAPSGDPATALHWCRSREPAVRALVETLVAHPEEAVPDFLEFAELSRREWFAAEWTRVRPLLAARARTFADLTRRRGTAAALATLDPSVTVTAPDEAAREVTGTRLRRAGRTSYEYDSQGRVVRTIKRLLNGQSKVRTFTWNTYDQLVATVTPDGEHWRYLYDPAGRRIAKQRLTAA